MELLSGVLVNNGMKNLKNYYVSQIYGKGVPGSIHRIRHITTTTIPSYQAIYLCKYKSEFLIMSSLYNYSIGNIGGVKNVPVCKTCLNKLPKKVKEEFIYNWAVTKLKTK